MSFKSSLAAFWSRYKRWIVVALVVYVIVTLALVFLTRGPQSEPFIYQVF